MGLHVQKVNKEEIIQYASDLLVEKMEENIDKIGEYVKNNAEKIVSILYDELDKLYQRGAEMQQSLAKDDIAYISIFLMRHYYYTRNNPIQIYLYDSTRYLDKNECMIEMNLDFIMDYYNQDLEYIEKELKKKYIRIDEDVLQEIKKRYLGEYYRLIVNFFVEAKDLFLMASSIDNLRITDDLQITIGEYLDEGTVIGGL